MYNYWWGRKRRCEWPYSNISPVSNQFCSRNSQFLPVILVNGKLSASYLPVVAAVVHIQLTSSEVESAMVILMLDKESCLKGKLLFLCLYMLNRSSFGIYWPCYFNYVDANDPFHSVFCHLRKVQILSNCFKCGTYTFVLYSYFPCSLVSCCAGRWGSKWGASQSVHTEYNSVFKIKIMWKCIAVQNLGQKQI
jgi:hypothetical protein